MKITTTSIFALMASTACSFYAPQVVRSLLLPQDPPLHLARRDDEPASDDVWNKAKCIGGQFVKVFPMNDKDAGQEYLPKKDSVQSKWKGDLKDDLKKWGWTQNTLLKSVCEFDEFALGKGWVDAAKQLSIGTEGWKDIWCYRFSHGTLWDVAGEKTYNVQPDNKDYPVWLRSSISCGMVLTESVHRGVRPVRHQRRRWSYPRHGQPHAYLRDQEEQTARPSGRRSARSTISFRTALEWLVSWQPTRHIEQQECEECQVPYLALCHEFGVFGHHPACAETQEQGDGVLVARR
ncbi:hypothetical protein PMIN03_009449 [Paraphaeosphaeria minitans]